MTRAIRYNTYSPLRPPLEFGVSYDYTSGTAALTRLGAATGLTVNTTSSPHVSGFSSYYPWAGIRRVTLVEISGDVYAAYGNLNDAGVSVYDDDNTDFQTMVEIPKFYVKFSQTGTVLSYYISPYPLKGYRLHPAFVRRQGILDHIYVGAFEGYETGGYFYSVANQTPKVSQTRATFRGYVTGWQPTTPIPGYGWHLMTGDVWAAIQLLYLVEYAHTDSQTPSGSTAVGGLGDGLVHIAAVQKTGYTSGSLGTELGNASGRVAVAGSDYAISYRGIENPWGNTNTWLDGINVSTSRIPWFADYTTEFSNVVTYTGYINSAEALPAAAGYSSYPTFTSAFRENCQFMPVGTGAPADATHGSCDYYQIDAAHGFAAVKVPRVGGAFDQGTPAHAGIFYIDVALELAESNANTGARLQYTPYDYTNFYRYW